MINSIIIGLSIVGLKFGFIIGLLAGLVSIIPYAGFSLGFLASITMALANYSGPNLLIGIVVIFVVVQVLEGLVITPKLVGDKVGLSAFITMLALIIGGNLFGLVGMIIAIPCAAIIKSLISDLKREYVELDFYKS
jgi:predicted PurR-regulated permease PerM